MTVILIRPANIRRLSWGAVILSLCSLVGGLITVAIGHEIGAENLLLPCSVMIGSIQGTRPNILPRRDVLLSAVSMLLTVVAIVFLAVRVAG